MEEKTNRQLVKGKSKSSKGFPSGLRKTAECGEGSNSGIRIIKSGVRYDYRKRMRKVTTFH